MTHEDIIRNVRSGKVAPVYCLMGEEDYYIDKLSDFLIDALLKPEERDFNLDVVYGMDTTVNDVIELARAYPLMSERRLVVVREAQSMRSYDGLESYLRHITPSTVLVLCYKHGKLDKPKGIVKALQDVGVVYESKRLWDSQLPGFITGYFKHKGVAVEPQVVQMLAAYVGADLMRLSSEMDKLVLSLGQQEKTVTTAHVGSLTGMSKEYNDFELVGAIARKNENTVYRILDNYKGNNRTFSLQRTLSVLFTFFSDVMISYYSPDKSDRGVAAWLGKPEWKVRQDILPAQKNYSGRKVMQILGEIRKTDASSKGVEGCRTAPEDLLVELLFFILH